MLGNVPLKEICGILVQFDILLLYNVYNREVQEDKWNKNKMTVNHVDISVKGKRVKHPNEIKYPGRPCVEAQKAFNQVMECLPIEDMKKFLKGTLVHDEERTAELFDQIQVGDTIGLCSHREGYGMVPEQWVVKEIPKDADILKCHIRNAEEATQDIYFEDISIGLVMGMAEILLRGEKPFGVTEEIEYKVRVFGITKTPKELLVEDDADAIDNMISEGGPIYSTN